MNGGTVAVGVAPDRSPKRAAGTAIDRFDGLTLCALVASGGVPFLGYFAPQFPGATGEEIGWRGLMQPALESRLGRLTSWLIVEVTWVMWRIQVLTATTVIAGSFPVAPRCLVSGDHTCQLPHASTTPSRHWSPPLWPFH